MSAYTEQLSEHITTLFSDKLIDDDREVIYTFDFNGDTFGVYPPKIGFWLQLLVLFFVQVFLQVVYAAIIYKCIVQTRKSNPTLAYLVGFVFVIPTVCAWPYPLLEYFQLQNKTLKLSLGTMPMIVVFRCIEAMFATSPHTVETSLGHYMAYYSSLAHFEWDPTTQKRRQWTWPEFGAILGRLLAHFHLAGLVLSVAMHFDYKLIPTNVQVHHYNFTWELFTPANLVNSYMIALLAFLMLSVGFEMSSFGDNIKGFVTIQPFYNPLFTSRSPKDFWGRKWNTTVHNVVKFGAYKPARKVGLNRHLSYVIAFLASGVLHDYCWTIMYYSYGDENAYQPVLFKTTAFFLWNYGLMGIEEETKSYWGFTKSWPTPLVSTLVVITALPVAHWYTGDWAASNYFGEYGMGLWLVRKL